MQNENEATFAIDQISGFRLEGYGLKSCEKRMTIINSGALQMPFCKSWKLFFVRDAGTSFLCPDHKNTCKQNNLSLFRPVVTGDMIFTQNINKEHWKEFN